MLLCACQKGIYTMLSLELRTDLIKTRRAIKLNEKYDILKLFTQTLTWPTFYWFKNIVCIAIYFLSINRIFARYTNISRAIKLWRQTLWKFMHDRSLHKIYIIVAKWQWRMPIQSLPAVCMQFPDTSEPAPCIYNSTWHKPEWHNENVTPYCFANETRLTL